MKEFINDSSEDSERFKQILRKYSEIDGTISFINRLNAHIEFVESMEYKDIPKGFNVHDFYVNKKAMLDTLKHIEHLVEMHDVKGDFLYIDWEGL